MTPCPVASRIFHDWTVALREASHPEHRDCEELLTSYAGAVASTLDRHLAACAFCKETTMTQHTPGPWMTHGQYVITGNDDGPIDAHTEHDARLIAAAPELLEALRFIAEDAETSQDHLYDVAETARAAIAKATSAPPDPDHA